MVLGSETGNTTKSESIDMEKECLIEETSFDYGKGGALAEKDLNQTLTGLKVKTKKTLGKPLGKINFSSSNVDDDVLLNAPLELPLFLKNLVNVSVCKSFALDIGLDKVGGKSSQEKLQVIRKAMFTSELNMAQALKKAEEAKILVNTNLKKSSECSDQAVVLKKIPIETSTEAVHTVLSEFELIKSIKMQLSILIEKDAVRVARSDVYKALLYTLPMGTNAHDIWDYIASVVIRCSHKDHDCSKRGQSALILSCFSQVCWVWKIGPHISLVGGKKNISSGASLWKTFSNSDKFRLAAIYAKHSASVACSVFFGGVSWAQIAGGFSFPFFPGQNVLLKAGSSSEMKPTPLVSLELNNRFATLEHSFASLTECIDMLAKRLDTPEPMVSQLSPRHQPLSSDVVTGGKTVAGVVAFDSTVISKMEKTLNNLSITVMSLSAKLNNTGSEMNNPVKQDDIIHWHKNMNNLVSIFMESKLKEKIHPWIVNKFDTKHVCKVSEVPGRLLFIKLLFKNKLSVSILGLYAGVSLAVWFSQAGKINSLIAKTVNESSFVVFDSDFNKDGSHKCTSFKKCLDLELVNFLVSVMKTIDYVFVSPNLVSVMVCHGIFNVSEHFDTDHQAVSVSLNLGGLLDMHLNSLYRQANRDSNGTFKKKWFKDFDSVFTKESSRFHKLELLVSKMDKFDSTGALAVKSFFLSGSNFDIICSVLAKARKLYHSSKLLEFKYTEESHIKQTIVVGDELILKPNLVKFKMDEIMEGWTKKLGESVPEPWREAWVLMISKPYEWEGVFMNTYFIALIETACTITQSPIFAIGSVVEDVLKKNRELWLVLQDMHKAYNSVDWEHLKRSLAGLTSFFAASTFVDDTIWVGSSQAATQHILDIASEFFSPISVWFELSVHFLNGVMSPSASPPFMDIYASSDILQSHKFEIIGNNLLCVDAAHLFVFTDGSLSGLGTLDMKAGTAAYFEDIDLGLRIKGHLDVLGNKHADALAKSVVLSGWHLPYLVGEKFLRVGSTVVFGNSKHFVCGVFQSVHQVCWEIGSGS
ncbi:hypothetical protein G9A89_003813 [Geosiphon pyriformis]|nr:hypothetical protein G9A89_003813 [Geosiphon pyriformis]